MESLIIVGTQEAQDQFISQFIIKHSILPYHIYKFGPKVKINEIRELKKQLSQKFGTNRRLFVLQDSLTTEAQNALLKSLEERPEGVFILMGVSSVERLLPTITSRCHIVRLDQTEMFKKDTELIISDSLEYRDVYKLLQEFNFASDNDQFTSLLMRLRNYINSSLVQGMNVDEKILKSYITLCLQYSFCISNNINKRFATEYSFLNSSL